MNIFYTLRTVGSLAPGTRVEVTGVDKETGVCECLVFTSEGYKNVEIHEEDLDTRRPRTEILKEVKHADRFTQAKRDAATRDRGTGSF